MPLYTVSLQESTSYVNLYFQQKKRNSHKSNGQTAFSPLSPVLECHATEARPPRGTSNPGRTGPRLSYAAAAMLVWVERRWQSVKPLCVSQEHECILITPILQAAQLSFLDAKCPGWSVVLERENLGSNVSEILTRIHFTCTLCHCFSCHPFRLFLASYLAEGRQMWVTRT